MNYVQRPQVESTSDSPYKLNYVYDEPERKVVKGNTRNEKIGRHYLNVLDSGCYGKARRWHCKINKTVV